MTAIHDCKEMRNLSRVFRDRTMAGRKLGYMLRNRFGGQAGLLMLAIPMGGIPVALPVQEQLNCALDLLIVRKIQVPDNPEAGIGAMTQEGDVFINEPLVKVLKLTADQVDGQIEKVREELARRNLRLRQGRPFPHLLDKTVILVDDGMASGYTMKASIHMVSKRGAASLSVAVPTASRRTLDAIKDNVDELFCPNIRDVSAFAVADAYEVWHDISEKQAEELLAETVSAD
jgi:putative phosphoribosyl transferase